MTRLILHHIIERVRNDRGGAALASAKSLDEIVQRLGAAGFFPDQRVGVEPDE
jgi:hypothetical protein